MRSADRDSLAGRLQEIDDSLCTSETLRNPAMIRSLKEERFGLARIVEVLDAISATEASVLELRSLLGDDDAELAEMARADLPGLEALLVDLSARLKRLLIPPEPNDARDVIVEIRSGTGGEEAALFAGEVYRMYSAYAQKKGWTTEVITSSGSERGGLKEIIFSIKGGGVYSRLKFEAGVHRVQRVPETETSGRIHTSACTVAVLPEPEEVEVQINQEDLRIDVYRSTGPGGQSVNTTDSAVRITHIPTGLVVSCQDEKSQHKNRAQALKVLRTRLFALKQDEENARRAQARKTMVGSGDRSAKIRTYNFPQSRLTDHRIQLTVHSLREIMAGDLDQVIDPLIEAEQERLLSEISAGEG
jgi:peptide chain release factor 1